MDIERTCECKIHIETIAALKNIIDGQSKMIAEKNMAIETFEGQVQDLRGIKESLHRHLIHAEDELQRVCSSLVKIHMNHSVRYTAHDADYFDAQKERVAYVLRKSPITERTVDNGKNGQRR